VLPVIKKTILGMALIVIAIGVMHYTNNKVSGDQGENTMAAKTIEEALKEHTEALMSLRGVVGTAQGLCDDQPCIKIYVNRKTPELEQKIPNILEGYPVTIEETGEIRAFPEDQD
jgi:hypothetical protein